MNSSNQPFFLAFMLLSLVLSSCSDNDYDPSEDIIVGRWVGVERYEDNVLVENDLCLPFYWFEYKSDNDVSFGFTSDDYPVECGATIEFGTKWKNLGGSLYYIGSENRTQPNRIVRKEGDNLLIYEMNEVDWVVFAPYLN